MLGCESVEMFGLEVWCKVLAAPGMPIIKGLSICRGVVLSAIGLDVRESTSVQVFDFELSKDTRIVMRKLPTTPPKLMIVFEFAKWIRSKVPCTVRVFVDVTVSGWGSLSSPGKICTRLAFRESSYSAETESAENEYIVLGSRAKLQ